MKEFDPKITKSILTGIQPSGVITLGNYIGAIRQMVRMQDLFIYFYCRYACDNCSSRC